MCVRLTWERDAIRKHYGKASGGSVTLSMIFCCGSCIHVGAILTCTTYLNIVADSVHSFVATAQPNGSGLFQQGNAPCRTVKVLTWPPNSCRSQSEHTFLAQSSLRLIPGGPSLQFTGLKGLSGYHSTRGLLKSMKVLVEQGWPTQYRAGGFHVMADQCDLFMFCSLLDITNPNRTSSRRTPSSKPLKFSSHLNLWSAMKPRYIQLHTV